MVNSVPRRHGVKKMILMNESGAHHSERGPRDLVLLGFYYFGMTSNQDIFHHGALDLCSSCLRSN